ncbi:trypsin-like serine protease [Candidatus Dependentiae bacterium]|nr:trypsin-like serine protease [Candidatus Dependentiae bacterium]
MYNRSSGIFKNLFFSVLILSLPLGLFFYRLNTKHNDLARYVEFLVAQKGKELEKQKVESKLSQELAPKTWLEVQKKVKDTVVQVFTLIDDFNWVQPYKTPKQGSSAGSGFFIDKQGHIVTNYHVVSQASSVKIQIPSFGRHQFDVDIIGVYPDKDVALLKLTKASYNDIIKGLGKISYLSLGDSDSVLRTQEVLALGYPLGQERLKSTLGIVSGRERSGFIQITAPLNPGNSGGPSLNKEGKVIGINFAIVSGAQNVGYIIPVNEIKSALRDMKKVKLLRRPVLGCIFTVATPEMVRYLGNPEPGGWYIAEVFEDTILHKIGIQEDDMLYEVNGYRLDLYGEMSVPWSEDKISVLDFLNRYTVGDDIYFVVYRNGERKDFHFKLDNKYLPPIRKIYPEYEPEEIGYEVFGGLVVMPLTLNHIAIFGEKNISLANYIRPENQHEPRLIITHILPNSQAQKARILTPGSIIEEVNGQEVKTLDDFRKVVSKCKQDEYLTIRTKDKMFAALSVQKIIADEDRLSSRYFYNKSDLVEKIVKS